GRAACKRQIAAAQRAVQRATVLARRANIHINLGTLPSTGYGGTAPQAGTVPVAAGLAIRPGTVQFASVSNKSVTTSPATVAAAKSPAALPATGGAAH
ncbi:MAG: hypothetical protein LC772_10430, partial [Chloroflexi bacterium]|nr:hypothetical protein [Chloroflexota bacterium]